MLKKIISALCLVATLAFMPTGCKQDTTLQGENSENLNVIATVFAPYDFTRQIVGENANVTMLIPPASESHSYEPTPQDIIKILNADVFIYVGGESDEWVTDILSSIDVKDVKIVTLMDCVELYEEETVEGMQDVEHEHEHAEEEHDEDEHEHESDVEYDEHIWTSPKNAVKITEKILDAVCQADAQNAETYQANANAYIEKLNELDGQFENIVANAKRKTMIFGDRFPLIYFTKAYGLSYYAAFPGCAADAEPSAATVAFLIEKVKAEKIPVVFHIELSNEKMADTICEATGAKKLQFNSCHNLSKESFKNGATYLNLMYENVQSLQEALN